MRNLTVIRAKSFVACLAKMKVYIEDHETSEITINDVPCRKLGELKNGEEKTFSIEEREAKVFVIADQLSKSFCNEYYQLPEGQEDIALSGKNKFNPAAGNAFRFDNNESEEIAANRKKGVLKGLPILVIAVIVGALIGYFLTSGLLFRRSARAKTFSSDGMTITLTEDFKETKMEPYTVVYESKDAAVFVLREPFSLTSGFENNSLKDYADLVIRANNLGSAEVKTEDGLTYFVYQFTNPETKDVYHYFSYVYKTDDAFWMIQFTTLDKNAKAYAKQTKEWAKSVTFSD